MGKMVIRSAEEADYTEINNLIFDAFTDTDYQVTEHELVIKLRKELDFNPFFEVVAERAGRIVGHGFLSIAKVANNAILVLAPLSVDLNYRHQGIGGKILKELEDRGFKKGYSAISILGNPDYYGKFGYVPASQYGIRAPFEVEERYFTIKNLSESPLAMREGELQYAKSFELN